MHTHSPLWTHVCKPYPYEHLRRTEPLDLEFYEVTTGTSLSTGTSPIIENIVALNLRINYYTMDLNHQQPIYLKFGSIQPKTPKIPWETVRSKRKKHVDRPLSPSHTIDLPFVKEPWCSYYIDSSNPPFPKTVSPISYFFCCQDLKSGGVEPCYTRTLSTN
jgi:hypothetical protein